MGDLVTGFVGIAGVLIGLFADRLLQRQGKVRCVMDPIELVVLYTREKTSAHLRSLPIPAELLLDPESDPPDVYGGPRSRYYLNVKLFNEKEVKTGLRDLVIVFDGKPPLERTMLDRSTWRATQQFKQMDTLEVVNLPSREWVALSLMDNLSQEDTHKLTECDRVWLRGYFPDGTQFNKRVPFA